MFDKIDIHWFDPWFPMLNKSPSQRFQDFGELLFDIYSCPDFYKWFPEVPSEIFYNWKLKDCFSIIKKWIAFFVINRWVKWGKIIETMMPFSDKQIVFSFTIYDFPRISEMDFSCNSRWLSSNSLLNTYIFDILDERI